MLAIGVILYPLIANYLSEKNRSLIETQYTEAIKQMDTSALDAARAAAGAYNETLLTVPDKPFISTMARRKALLIEAWGICLAPRSRWAVQDPIVC